MQVLTLQDLPPGDLKLVQEAKNATNQSYAPYSDFHVGSALQLRSGEIITGSNQENASYPVCICGERLAILSAQHRYPGIPIETVAIVARKGEHGWTEKPVSPCGVCRQTISEVSLRQEKSIRLILIGQEEFWIIDRLDEILPASFNKSDLL